MTQFKRICSQGVDWGSDTVGEKLRKGAPLAEDWSFLKLKDRTLFVLLPVSMHTLVPSQLNVEKEKSWLDFFLLSTVRTDISPEKGRQIQCGSIEIMVFPSICEITTLSSKCASICLLLCWNQPYMRNTIKRGTTLDLILIIIAYIPCREKLRKETSRIIEINVLREHLWADVTGVSNIHKAFHTQVALKGKTVDLESGWNLGVLSQRGLMQFGRPQTASPVKHSAMQIRAPTGIRRTNIRWVLCRWNYTTGQSLPT